MSQKWKVFKNCIILTELNRPTRFKKVKFTYKFWNRNKRWANEPPKWRWRGMVYAMMVCDFKQSNWLTKRRQLTMSLLIDLFAGDPMIQLQTIKNILMNFSNQKTVLQFWIKIFDRFWKLILKRNFVDKWWVDKDANSMMNQSKQYGIVTALSRKVLSFLLFLIEINLSKFIFRTFGFRFQNLRLNFKSNFLFRTKTSRVRLLNKFWIDFWCSTVCMWKFNRRQTKIQLPFQNVVAKQCGGNKTERVGKNDRNWVERESHRVKMSQNQLDQSLINKKKNKQKKKMGEKIW